MFQTVASIIGTITGLVSLAGIIYLIGYWKGGIDTWRKSHEEEHKKYPASEIALMCKTMWDIYVVDALRKHPELAQHSSPFKLTEQGDRLIPEHLKTALCKIPTNPTNREAIATGWLVVKHLGIAAIEQMAKEKELSVQEAIAVLSTYLETHTDNCKPI
jgi:hypothetical protein